MDLKIVKKAYFIGIGGIGISALASMFLSKGIKVLGVNDEDSPKTLNPLKERGAEIILKDNFGLLPDADLYVYSDAWLYRGKEVIDAAKSTGKPVLSYFEALGEVSKDYKVIAISGTHGKTTTTSMVAEVLIDAGFDPTVIVGSFVKKFGSNFREGKSEYLVVEADEFNRHMLNFHPFIGAITNIDSDHLDVYKDLDEIKEAFNQFLSQSQNVITEKEYSKYLTEVPELLVPGEHNRKNAAVALAIADFLSIDKKSAGESLSNFSGTWRRFEYKGETKNGAIIYDDYAHHPAEIEATIKGAREKYPDKNIVVFFQPHLYSRTKALKDDFIKSLKLSDKVFLLPIYYAREDKDDSISSEMLVEEIGEKAEFIEIFEEMNKVINSDFGKNDVVIIMGAGNISLLAESLF